jgi:hypothetical protein
MPEAKRYDVRLGVGVITFNDMTSNISRISTGERGTGTFSCKPLKINN